MKSESSMVPESVCTTPVVSYHLAIKRGLISTNDFVDSRVEQELCILSTLPGIGVDIFGLEITSVLFRAS